MQCFKSHRLKIKDLTSFFYNLMHMSIKKYFEDFIEEIRADLTCELCS